ncbi:MAG: putative toxin-antitoxin system toxin component, PIN family [Microcystaceae cyanobacterium]
MKAKRFVLDSNIVLSAALFKQSIPRQALDKAFQEGQVVMSAAAIAELRDLFGRSKKFDKYLSLAARTNFLNDLLASVKVIEIIEIINVCRDPKDNKFLELAINGKANYIITGDQDLLVLNPFQTIQILTPQVFLSV